jgi:hypothetical protein
MSESDAENGVVLHSLGLLSDLQVSRVLSCVSLNSGPGVVMGARGAVVFKMAVRNTCAVY